MVRAFVRSQLLVRGDTSLADFLLCARCLGPFDDARAAGVARLIGLELASEAGSGRTVNDELTARRPGRSASGLEGDLVSSGDASEPASADGGSAGRRRLRPVRTRARAAGRPWSEVEALARSVPEIHGGALPHEPLWEPRWSRDLVAAALSTPTTGHAVDEPQAVKILSSGRPLTEVPRLPARTLARGGQILVDMGTAMDPFARDRYALAELIRSVTGRDRTPVVLFGGAPRAARADDDAWDPYLPPEPRTPVIALTNLCIGGPSGTAREGSPMSWLRVADDLRRRGSPLLAIVPYPPARWPTMLRGRMTILRWDRQTTLAEVRRRVLAAERR